MLTAYKRFQRTAWFIVCFNNDERTWSVTCTVDAIAPQTDPKAVHNNAREVNDSVDVVQASRGTNAPVPGNFRHTDGANDAVMAQVP